MCFIVVEDVKLYPRYALVLSENEKFVMCAQKEKFRINSKFIISRALNRINASNDYYLGEVVCSNILGLDWDIYDRGVKFDKKNNFKNIKNHIGHTKYVHKILLQRI